MLLPKPFFSWTTYENHPGIDFPYGRGVPIRASGAGVVRFRNWNRDKASGDAHSPGRGAGNTVIVKYDNGVELRYCHLDSLDGAPGPGVRVSEGDYLGPVGTTGLSTGYHLHLEVWVNGGIRKGAAFWDYVDKTRTVGDAKPAASDLAPFVPARPEEEDDMFSNEDRADLEAVKTIIQVLAGRVSSPVIPPLVMTADQGDGRVFVLMPTGEKRHINPLELSIYRERAQSLGYARADFDRLFINRIGNLGNIPTYSAAS